MVEEDGSESDLKGVPGWVPDPHSGEGQAQLVGRVIRNRLAERLGLASEWLDGLGSEPAAEILSSFTELDHQIQRTDEPEPVGVAAGPERPASEDLVAKVVRSETARRLRLPERTLAALDVRTSAQMLSRLNDAISRVEAERGQAERPAPPSPTIERRDVVARTLRDVLAAELGVSPRSLMGLDAGLASATLARIGELKVAVRRGGPEAEPGIPFEERRDLVARIIRDELARRSKVPPKLMGGLDAIGAAAILDGWEAVRRRLVQAQALVATDDLTGCFRRTEGVNLLDAEIARARRLAEGKLTLAFVDVVALKRVNDTSGHLAGDAILKHLSQAFKSRLRASDLVIRWGGDEFVCVLTDADSSQATAALEDVRTICRSGEPAFEFSYGVAQLGPDDDASSLVDRADAALYQARLRERPEHEEAVEGESAQDQVGQDQVGQDQAVQDEVQDKVQDEAAGEPTDQERPEAGDDASPAPPAPAAAPAEPPAQPSYRKKRRLFGRD